MTGAAWVYLILGAREQENKQLNDNSPNTLASANNGTEFWDYAHMNNNGNNLEDRVSASSGIASANSSSMPWGLPDVGSNIASGQSYGPQVNTYLPQSHSPSGRQLQDGLLEQELRNLTLRNGMGVSCRDGTIATPQSLPYNGLSAHPCDMNNLVANNPNLMARSRIDPLSSTPSPHFSGLPQIPKHDNIVKPRHFSPSLKNVVQTSQHSKNQSPAVGSSTQSQHHSEHNFGSNGVTSNRVGECLTETTDCQSEISVLTATTTTTAGPLISSRRESTRKSKKGIVSSDKENVSGTNDGLSKLNNHGIAKQIPFQNTKTSNSNGNDYFDLGIF